MVSGSLRHALLVTADDTTGALESAALMADAGWRVTVVPHATPRDARGLMAPTAFVVDLRSRHETPEVAAARFGRVAASVRAHKIDSTLRGNWAVEVRAAVAVGRRVLMVPAFPAAGRVCEHGVVREHGVPVDQTHHANDPRSPVRTSRPASVLGGAVELGSAADVVSWAGSGRAIGVADATDDSSLAAVVAAVAEHADVLVVGTAAVVGAVARLDASTARPVVVPATIDTTATPVAAPVLVVCGSMHPASRAQIDALLAAGARLVGDGSHRHDGVWVLVPSAEPGAEPAGVARSLAERAHHVASSLGARTVVLVGGDTAEAFIGTAPVVVSGSLGTGIARGTTSIDGGVALVAKPGAFGSANTLVDLMDHALNSARP